MFCDDRVIDTLEEIAAKLDLVPGGPTPALLLTLAMRFAVAGITALDHSARQEVIDVVCDTIASAADGHGLYEAKAA